VIITWGLLGNVEKARAQVEELRYDDGVSVGAIQLSPGDIEVVRFTADHPATLLTLRLYFHSVGGDTTVVVWGDNGGNAPDVDTVLFSGVVTPVAGDWTEIDLTAEGLDLPALENFYVGQIVTDASTLLGWDGTGSDDHRSLVRIDGDWFYVGAQDASDMAADALVRAVVEYHDVVDVPWFTDITETLGATDVNLSRMAWGDYDNDGDEDLLVNGKRLFANSGDGTFTEVTAQAGIGGTPTNGGVWADYDNDGHLDFYATVHNFLPPCTTPSGCPAANYTCVEGRCRHRTECVDVADCPNADDACTDDHCVPAAPEPPPAHDLLWRNNGDGTFTNVSEEAGRPYDFLPTEGAAWGDMDGDGFVDLYVANYETPQSWTGGVLGVATPDFLWQNQGDGTFADVSEEAGIRDVPAQCGRGVSWADYDDDGWQDIFVSNYRLDPNLLFRNRGYGLFENRSIEAGVAGVPLSGAYGHTIGSQWADFDNDGDWDLFTANLAHPRFIDVSDKSMLYINTGAPDFTFTDIREVAGIRYSETHSDTALGDFDNDGFIDLFVTGVYVGYRSFLYRHQGDLTFTDETYNAGTHVDNGWGAAWADIDNDGDLDLISRRLYRNDLTSTGTWLKVRLIGTQSNRAGIGARVTVTAGGRICMRQVEGGKGTTTQNALTLHFGLGDAIVADNLQIIWPSWPPYVENRQQVAIGRTVTYIEGGGELLDGGAGTDGATPDATPTDSGSKGCGCRAAHSDTLPSSLPLALLALLLLVIGRATRRHRRRPTSRPRR
jgi:MYXO-CTERM domain-containing protein